MGFQLQQRDQPISDERQGKEDHERKNEWLPLFTAFDGHFHAIVKALPTSQCQYCYFVWDHEYDKKQKKSWSFMEKNWKDIIRCVVSKCVNEWHGVDMQDTTKVLGY